jgi:serine/threonine-protein kinase HipA
MAVSNFAGDQVLRQGEVFLHGELAGELAEFRTGFRFAYLPNWVATRRRPVSASLPLRTQAYESNRLFPFFQGLLSEGELRRLQLRQARLDDTDEFGLLLATCQEDAAGAVTIRPVLAKAP